MTEATYKRLTPDEIRDDAIGTLQEWLEGYTHPLEGSNRPQHKITRLADKPDGMIVQYEVHRDDGMDVYYPVQYFEIELKVTELKDD